MSVASERHGCAELLNSFSYTSMPRITWARLCEIGAAASPTSVALPSPVDHVGSGLESSITVSHSKSSPARMHSCHRAAPTQALVDDMLRADAGTRHDSSIKGLRG